MYDGDQMKSYADFKIDVDKINSSYNRNYLQTEYNTARSAAEHARKWQEYQVDKKLFPNLKYMTVGDARVRPEHEKLNGVIKPLEDPFWDDYYPPNGWNCRCYTVQSAEDITTGIAKDETVKKEFIGNVGKSNIIFSKNQTFFQIAKELENKEIGKQFELSKLDMPLIERYKSPTGAKVRINPFTDKRPDELAGNYRVARLLADKENLNMDLMAHLDGSLVLGVPNPEYRINGKIADRKSPENDYKNVLKSASKQMCEIVVMDLSKNLDSIDKAETRISKLLSNSKIHESIKEVYFISADRKSVKHYIRKKQL